MMMPLKRLWESLSERLPTLTLAALVVYYATRVEPSRVEVKRLTLRIPDLDDAFVGYTLVQISDIHGDDWMTRTQLANHVQRINALEPDMVVITGDFITHRVKCDTVAISRHLRAIHAPDGVYAVPGNHDYKAPGAIDDVLDIMNESGIVNLANRVHTLRRDDAALHIAGIDDIDRGSPRLDLLLEQLSDDHPAILLAHEPDFADISAPTGRFAIQLSGHSHGGQIRIPLPVLRTFALPAYGRKYARGFRVVKGMQLHTNRGLGTVGIHARFRSPPEITHFTLKKAHKPTAKRSDGQV